MVPILDISRLLLTWNKDDKSMCYFKFFFKTKLWSNFLANIHSIYEVLPSSKNIVIHIETSQLICFENQLAGPLSDEISLALFFLKSFLT